MFQIIKSTVLTRSNNLVLCSFRQCCTNTKELNISQIIPPEEAHGQRLLKVAIIGAPNAGKSTFINNIMDRKVCATSSKVHTTRQKAMAVFTEGDSQIVFLDTPGLVNFQEHKKYNLSRSFLKDSKTSIQEAGIIGVIHDVGNSWTRDILDIKIIKLLEFYKYRPSFLILNKIDNLKSKRKLLDITRQLTENCLEGQPIPGNKQLKNVDDKIRGWPYFQRVFMVSSLTGSGLPEVKDFLLNNAKPGKWMFPSEIWSDQTAEQVIVNSVKAKLLDFLPQEIPYSLTPVLEFLDINHEGLVKTVVLVKCPSSRIAKLVSGAADGKLRQITESIQHDLQNTFQNRVRLQIVLESPKDENK